MTLKKILGTRMVGTLHLWLGIASGLMVFIIGITGATYTFVDELKPVFYKDRLFITPEKTPRLPLGELVAVAEKTLGKGKPVNRAEVFNQPDRTVIFRALKNDKEGFSHWDYYKYYYRVYVNPYNGKVVKVENTENEFFQLVLSLHMRMLFGEKIGHYVVGYSVLAFVILLISGIVLWVPKKWNKTGREKSFSIKWDAKLKRINYDLHNVLGFYAFVVLFVIALTGLVWVFDWMENSVRFVANGGENIAKTKLMLSDTTLSGSGTDRAFMQARNKNPQAYSYLVIFPAKNDGTINISTYLKNNNKYDRIQDNFDRYSGKLLRSASFDQLNGGDKMYQLNFDLHTGSILSLPGKILVFFAGLICASLPVTGFVIWWGRRKKSKKKEAGAGARNMSRVKKREFVKPTVES
jgi:uncharacterized iron-regulated membrane protein